MQAIENKRLKRRGSTDYQSVIPLIRTDGHTEGGTPPHPLGKVLPIFRPLKRIDKRTPTIFCPVCLIELGTAEEKGNHLERHHGYDTVRLGRSREADGLTAGELRAEFTILEGSGNPYRTEGVEGTDFRHWENY